MKYLGIFQSFQPILCKMPRLFANVEDVNIIITYDEQNPFFIENIGVLLDRHSVNNTLIVAYDVFECGIHFNTDEEAKSFQSNLLKIS